MGCSCNIVSAQVAVGHDNEQGVRRRVGDSGYVLVDQTAVGVVGGVDRRSNCFKGDLGVVTAEQQQNQAPFCSSTADMCSKMKTPPDVGCSGLWILVEYPFRNINDLVGAISSLLHQFQF